MAWTAAPCPECGQVTASDGRFCAYCGIDLLRQAEVPVFAPRIPSPHHEGAQALPRTSRVEQPPARGSAIDGTDLRSQRSTGILFASFGIIVLLLGVAGIFLLRQWALLFVAFGVAFLAVGKRKIREASAPPVANGGR